MPEVSEWWRVTVDLLAAVRQLQELQEKATPGPWEVDAESAKDVVILEGENAAPENDPGTILACLSEIEGTRSHYRAAEDAELIVAAVNLVGPLIEAVEAAHRVVSGAVHVDRHTDGSVTVEVEGDYWDALSAALALPGGEE